jgi:hypothetical protein
MSSEETDAVTSYRRGIHANVINGMHAKFNSQPICNQRYNHMISAGTGALWPRLPGGLLHSLRCGAKPRSPCPIATGAFTESVFWADARPSIKMALLYVCESEKSH